MYRITVGVLVFVAIVLLGVGPAVNAQTINVNDCPDISTGTWDIKQEKVRFCYTTPAATLENPTGPAFYPSSDPSLGDTSERVQASGTVTFYQNALNNCLFTAYRLITYQDGAISSGWFTGVIYGNGTKITLHTLAKWNSKAPEPGDYSTPQAAFFGDLTINKRTKTVTQITYAGNSQFGLDLYSPSWVGLPHCNESIYGVMTQTP